MSLAVDVRHRLGDFTLDVRFESEGRLTALFGRSGSGKTSIVNLVAGLMRPDEGRIAVDGAELVDTARGLFVPRHKRRVGYVFQEGRLFPHLSVRRNLLYGRFFARAREKRIAIDQVGVDRVREAFRTALEPFVRPDGSVHLDNVFRVVIAHA